MQYTPVFKNISFTTKISHIKSNRGPYLNSHCWLENAFTPILTGTSTQIPMKQSNQPKVTIILDVIAVYPCFQEYLIKKKQGPCLK